MLKVKTASELDVVELLEDFPDYGLKKGERGTVVEVFDTPEEAYMIEFIDESGTDSKIADWVLPHQVENLSVQAEDFFNRGIEFYQQGKPVEAAREFRKAVKIKPNLIRSLHNSFYDKFASKELLEQFIVDMKFVMNINPHYELAKQNLAISYLNYGAKKVEEGNLIMALNSFLSAFRIEVTTDIAELVKKNIATVHTILGIQAHKERRLDDTVRHMESAYIFDETPETRKRLGLAYSIKGEASLLNGEYEKALMNYIHAEQTGMLTSGNLNNRALANAHLGQIDEAMMALESALEIDPTNTAAKKNLKLIKQFSSLTEEQLQKFRPEPIEVNFPLPPPTNSFPLFAQAT
jgi:tetratricopeptide (TPR) repeat protein